MISLDDVKRELDTMIRVGLTKTRESFAGSNISEYDLAQLMFSEQKRLEEWRDQTLAYLAQQAAEIPAPAGVTVRTIEPPTMPSNQIH